jgi:exodeoxyribonuclease V gamma subunit
MVEALAEEPDGLPATLLDHVRADLRADRLPTPFARQPTDTSIQVHACHGTVRQLEVMRDALGHLFAGDQALRPDDVVVICPDLPRFEPFAAAVFARGTLPIPIAVSDLSLGTENPVAAALATILHTVAGRCTASDVLGLCALEPVRRRLAITADDLDRFGEWTQRLGTRWGLDAEHRSEWLDSDIALGTWEQAVRSLLLGVAMPAPTQRVAFGGVVPYDDLGGDDVSSVGRLAELIARVRRLRRLSSADRPIGGWCDILVDTVAELCAPPPSEAWQTAAVLEAIDDIRRSAAVGELASAVPLGFDDLIAVVDGVIADRRGRVQLRTGRVTITGSVPVRNVPAKVVGVLGFDESSLQRSSIDGDDLLAVRPCVGERDRHAERRNLLLDAVFAAERALVVTCDGNDVTTNRPMRFAVQLSELLDVVDATLGPVGGSRHGDEDSPVLTRHPLHAYDERNFDLAGISATGGIFSFDDVMCHAADTRRHRSDDASAAAWRRFDVAVPIAPVVSLRQLVDACVRPAQTLLRDGLDVVVPDEVARIDHEIPLSVSKLDTSAVGRRLLDRYWRHAALLGADAVADDWEAGARVVIEEWALAERLAGAAPPGRLIDDTLDQVAADIDVIIAAAQCCGLDRAAVLGAGEVIDVDLELTISGDLTNRRDGLPDRLRLVDSIGRIRDGVIYRLGYRRPKAGFLVAAAIDLAAAVLATGDRAWRAVTATRAAQGTGAAECHVFDVIATDPQAAARTLLETAADLRVAALSGAVPVFEATTRTVYDKGFVDEDELVGTDFRKGDLADPSNHFVWGDISVGEISALSPSPKQLADRIWGAIHALASLEPVGDKVTSS